jgi:phage regulator Rha-like protein
MDANYLLVFALIFSIFFAIFVVIGFTTKVIISQEKIMNEFEAIKKELLAASNREEFNAAYNKAVKWNKMCWHKSHARLTGVINGIIEAKGNEIFKG